MRLLRRASLLSERVGDRLFLRRVGTSRAVYLLLRTIDETEGGVVSQQSVAGLLGLTKGAVSRLAAAAQQEGWLAFGASPVSRRENALLLTPEGRELVERGREVQAEYEQRASEQLSDVEVSAAVKALSVICQALEEEEQR
jgi:DNA-binding MarR family transcriptional regulator